MDEFELWVKDTLGLEPSTLTDSGKQELRASWNAKTAASAGNLDIDRQVAEAKKKLGLEVGGEMVRLNKVRACFDQVVTAWSKDQPEHVEKRGKAEELRAKATANEGNAWSTEKIELEFLKLGYPSTVITNTQGNGDLSQNVLECAAAHTTMMADSEIAKHWRPETIEAARHPRMRGIGLKGLIFQCACAKGYKGDWIQNDAECKEALLYAFPNPHALRAEASTFQLPGLLSNLMNKYLEQGFWEVEKVYQEISTSRPVKDFKPNPSFRLFGNLQYEKIGANGEIPQGDLGEIVYSNAADTYAKGYTTTRQAIINDDLSALSQIPQLFGRGAALTLNYVFWTVFLQALDSQGVAMFSAGRGNLNTGNALSSAGLTVAEQAFNEMLGPDNAPFAMDPEVLLVPPALKDIAVRLMTSDRLWEAVTALSHDRGQRDGHAGRQPPQGLLEAADEPLHRQQVQPQEPGQRFRLVHVGPSRHDRLCRNRVSQRPADPDDRIDGTDGRHARHLPPGVLRLRRRAEGIPRGPEEHRLTLTHLGPAVPQGTAGHLPFARSIRTTETPPIQGKQTWDSSPTTSLSPAWSCTAAPASRTRTRCRSPRRNSWPCTRPPPAAVRPFR